VHKAEKQGNKNFFPEKMGLEMLIPDSKMVIAIPISILFGLMFINCMAPKISISECPIVKAVTIFTTLLPQIFYCEKFPFSVFYKNGATRSREIKNKIWSFPSKICLKPISTILLNPKSFLPLMIYSEAEYFRPDPALQPPESD
jgi:hypothetical protein